MSWVLLKNSNAVQMLQKLAILQTKLSELVVKQKYNDMQMKLRMAGIEEKKDEKNGRKSTGD